MQQLKRARKLATERSPHREELGRFLSWIEKTPSTHTVRGMYVGGVVQAIQSMGFAPHSDERIQAFKEYPLQGYMELLLDSAVSLYPELTVHDGLRKLGGLAIPTFAKSIAGSVIMATVGRNWDIALTCVSRGYEVSLRPGKCIVTENANGRAIVQLRNVWNFSDSYQVGVMEGLMEWCKLEGRVTAMRTTMCDADLTIEWETARDVSRSRSREVRSGAGMR